MTERRAVAICACGVTENRETQCEAFFMALANDGTVWITDDRMALGNATQPITGPWIQLQELPQPPSEPEDMPF